MGITAVVRRAEAELPQQAELVPERLREWWLQYLRTHRRHYISTLSRLPPPEQAGRVLEVGSVPGHLTLMLRQLGYDVAGVDLDPSRVAALWETHELDVRRVDVEREPLPFPDASVSCVVFTEILEHLRVHPLFALRETRRVLRPDGRLILSVPNIRPTQRLGFLLGRDYQGDVVAEFEKLDRIGHMGHIRIYSIAEVRRMLEHVGYTGIEHAREGAPRGGLIARRLVARIPAFRARVYFTAVPA